MEGEGYSRPMEKHGQSSVLRSTHFAAARKSKRKRMVGDEAGKVDRDPNQGVDLINKYSLKTCFVSDSI